MGQDLSDYDVFVKQSPQRIVYAQTWWLEAVAPGRFQVLTVRRGDHIAAAWPLVWSPRGRSKVVMPPLTQKLGVLFAPSNAKYAERLSNEHRLVDELLAQIPPGTAIDQSFHEQFSNWLPFHWQGCRQTTRYTYLLRNLSEDAHLWKSLRSAARQRIRKAQREGIRVVASNDLEQFYRINCLTFQRQGIQNPIPFSLVQRLDAACCTHAGRKILFGQDSQGRVHAASYLVHDSHTAVYLLGGITPDYAGSGAKTLVDWEMVRLASTLAGTLDFEGSMIPSIERYFRDFGAEQVAYSRIWGTPRPGVWGRLPARWRRLLGRALRSLARHIDGLD